MRSMILPCFLSAGLIALLCGSIRPTAGAQERTLSRYEYVELHMGVRVRLVVYASGRAEAEKACEAAFRRFAELEDIMSDYRPHSELMRLCSRAFGNPVPVSRDLFLVLRHAQEVARRTDGAFDITVGPYVQLWRRARQGGAFPLPSELEEARRRVGWRKVRLDPTRRTVQLLAPGMRLDLGGIAKGYACDCALVVLRRHGIRRALVEAGGEIVVGDPPPGEPGWRIEIENAVPGQEQVILTNAAISTSGDTVQFLEYAGKRYSHVIDPRTGLGLTTRYLATVIAPSGLVSDSLATAMSVLGPERGNALLREYPGVRAWIRKVDL
ncbi:MAG: FAD:protein FMN transferase [Chloroherpetonaceae bacterium]|nr:FAD:protein FMN transferase [Chthonomonadaceae bacterium]MDW8206964.1 FAD:protein FMN transferase [Chloroherpetonaceae bacterium]